MNFNRASCHIIDISSNQNHVMYQCSGGNQSVNNGHRFTLFFKLEAAHKQSLASIVENQRYRRDRQERFNYCSRQTARRAWMRDHRSIEICRFFNEIGDYKLKAKHGRQWLHGRGCIRPGTPMRAIPLTNVSRMRVSADRGQSRQKPQRKRPRKPGHI